MIRNERKIAQEEVCKERQIAKQIRETNDCRTTKLDQV
jgi:hypothetical protein